MRSPETQAVVEAARECDQRIGNRCAGCPQDDEPRCINEDGLVRHILALASEADSLREQLEAAERVSEWLAAYCRVEVVHMQDGTRRPGGPAMDAPHWLAAARAATKPREEGAQPKRRLQINPGPLRVRDTSDVPRCDKCGKTPRLCKCLHPRF